MAKIDLAVENYLKEMEEIRSTGGGTKETSYYTPLCNLLNDIGQSLKPKIKCISILKNLGAGNPDFGLFTSNQFRKNKDIEPLSGQLPERGAIEAKPTDDDSWVTAEGKQVSKYWERYGQVLVTNYRDFVFVGKDWDGQAVKLETFRFAESEKEFWQLTKHPRKTSEEKGGQFVEYLLRVMQYSAALKNPKDLAWFLASYARESRARIEAAADLPGLSILRKGLEDALGLKFTGKDGEHFFRATLIQTLFYGIFSSWVLWSRKNKSVKAGKFNWHEAAWDLHVPMIASLFEQIATPNKLKPLGIDEVLDWAGMVLNRVDRQEFFKHFEEEHAIQYFYEPFLEAYDPELRKELGVWYTPPEIVRYQVQRIDTVLREELDIADGLADENVYVLDPCCGTGTYLIEVLKKIHIILEQKGGGALTAQQLKKAAINRVFGFEILPAPFVISHLQLGLLLREFGTPLSDEKNERAGVYLTNALTGWEPLEKPKDALPFPALQEEKDAAEKIKQQVPILVILGNPPYNTFAGISPEEEGDLVEAYKEGLNKPIKDGGWGIKKFNLDDLYIRFFRIAERRIVKGGRGVVSFISSFSYLSDPSFVVMRNNLLKEFDKLWFDCMNGDSRETGKLTPEGKPDPSVFSTEYNKAGIRVGTAVSLMVRKGKRDKTPTICFRHFWGVNKRTELLDSLDSKNFYKSYAIAKPDKTNRYSFRPLEISEEYQTWPDLLIISHEYPHNGPIERRGNSLILFPNEKEKFNSVHQYLDSEISNDVIATIEPRFMKSSGEFNAEESRASLLGKAQKTLRYEESNIRSYPFKPFDNRLAYLDAEIAPLFSRPSPSLLENATIKGNSYIITRSKASTVPEGVPFLFSARICDYSCISGGARFFPLWIKTELKKSKDDDGMTNSFLGDHKKKEEVKANLSKEARAYLKRFGFDEPDKDKEVAELIWMHSLAIGYSQKYLNENADGIRQDWPRIPLPDSKKALINSAKLGKQIAALLDTEQTVDGVTSGNIVKELSSIGVISRAGGGNINPDKGELDVTAGWGHAGKDEVCMPGKGNIITRPYTEDENKVISSDQKNLLGKETCDVYLNDTVFIKNIPVNVWDYYIGGYQVIKKWLSYREKSLLGRGLTMEEVLYVREMARRISAIVLNGSNLDSNYLAVKESTYKWNT